MPLHYEEISSLKHCVSGESSAEIQSAVSSRFRVIADFILWQIYVGFHPVPSSRSGI